VISQRLIKRADNSGRAVAAEVLINTPAVKDMMMDASRLSEIKDYMEANREQYGMQSFDQALADLVTTKQISFAAAMAAASKPADFELKLRMFARMSTTVKQVDDEGNAVAAPAGAMEGMQAGGGLEFLQQ
jgi:Tfp pilus assembly ATPase PilU